MTRTSSRLGFVNEGETLTPKHGRDRRPLDLTLLGFLKATVVGGAIFLLPVALLLVLLSHAMTVARKVAEPLQHLVPETVVPHGFGLLPALTVLILLVVSLAAGLFARTDIGRRIGAWLEQSFLGAVPQYQLVKGMAEGLAELETTEGLVPVLVNIEDGWQIGYQLEELEEGWLALFLPQAPTPMSGTIIYLPASRVRPLDVAMLEVAQIIKHAGIGSKAALQGVRWSGVPEPSPAEVASKSEDGRGSEPQWARP